MTKTKLALLSMIVVTTIFCLTLIFHIQLPLGYKGDSATVETAGATERDVAGAGSDNGAIESFSLESNQDLTADPTLAAEEITPDQSEANVGQNDSLTEDTDASGEASEEYSSTVTSANADISNEVPEEEQPKEEQPNVDQSNEDQPSEDQPNEDQPNEDQPNEDQPNEDQPNEDQPNEEQPEAKYANIGISIAKDYVNIRKDPSTDGEILGKLYRNSACMILKTEGEWYYVESGSVKGYVKAEFIKTGLSDDELIKNYSTQKILVDVDGLNVREEKSTDSRKLTVIYQNEKYPVEQIDGEWIKINIEDEDITGYVKAELVELIVDFKEAVSKEEEQLLLQLQAEERAKKETVIIQNDGYSYTAEDLKLLACLVHSEAGTQSYEGKLAVANVVLNRMKSSKFPDTIKEVVYQSGQFSVAKSGSLEKQLNNYDNYSSKSQLMSIKAAKDALGGANNIGSRKYFHSYKAAVKKGYDLITSSVKIGDHLFW